MNGQMLSVVETLVAEWQKALGENVRVVLGGSLISGLFILDDETRYIDVDVRFLTDVPESVELRERIEAVTGLKYRKTITVNDWPTGTSVGVMVEGVLTHPELALPLDVEGCIRNPKYIGWARFYQSVLTPDELSTFRRKKVELRHNKPEYKKLKEEVRAEVARRCVERGLVKG